MCYLNVINKTVAKGECKKEVSLNKFKSKKYFYSRSTKVNNSQDW